MSSPRSLARPISEAGPTRPNVLLLADRRALRHLVTLADLPRLRFLLLLAAILAVVGIAALALLAAFQADPAPVLGLESGIWRDRQ
jgi:hypothetical protein